MAPRFLSRRPCGMPSLFFDNEKRTFVWTVLLLQAFDFQGRSVIFSISRNCSAGAARACFPIVGGQTPVGSVRSLVKWAQAVSIECCAQPLGGVSAVANCGTAGGFYASTFRSTPHMKQRNRKSSKGKIWCCTP